MSIAFVSYQILANGIIGTDIRSVGHRRAAHLLRRTSYRYTKSRVDQLAAMSVSEALADLLQYRPLQLDQPLFDNPQTTTIELQPWCLPPGLPLPDQDFRLRRRLLTWWTHEAFSDAGAAHKLTFFFHQFMTVDAISYQSVHFFDHLALLRWGALGNFKKMAMKMVLDNCMLRYLNNQQNTKTNPNENFAREFFELFTIGKGPQIGPGDYTNYTEDDIKAAARLFTGFRTRQQRDIIDAETGIPSGQLQFGQHDTGSKAFSDKFQSTVIPGATNAAGMMVELQAFVDMVFAQAETARTTCRRLYRFFVGRTITPEIESDIIEPLAVTFRNSGYEMKPVLEQLLSSKNFYDEDDANQYDEIFGSLIKSPLELTGHALSFFDIAIPSPTEAPQQHHTTFYAQGVLDRMFLAAGLNLFMPTDVAGYPAYYQEPDYNRAWFNSSTIIARYKLPAMLITGRRQIGSGPNASIGIKLNLAPWLRDSGVVSDPHDPYVVVKDLLDYMLPEPVSGDRFNYFYVQTFLDGLPPADWAYEWDEYLQTDNASEVALMLERLVTAIMYSPEYQTF